jgi:hypothetical protein
LVPLGKPSLVRDALVSARCRYGLVDARFATVDNEEVRTVSATQPVDNSLSQLLTIPVSVACH